MANDEKACPFHFNVVCRKDRCALWFTASLYSGTEVKTVAMCGLLALTKALFNIDQKGIYTWQGV